MSNGASEEAVYGDSERRAAAASCWKAELLNHPLLVHLVEISTSQHDTSVFWGVSFIFCGGVLSFLSLTLPVRLNKLVRLGDKRAEGVRAQVRPDAVL